MSHAHSDDTRRERKAPWGPGVVVGGRFRLVAPIGSGAMGEVWRAQHLTLATTVAVKLVDLAAQQDRQEATGRFLQEAQAAARLQSPHVVRILDQGSEGQVAYLAMELLDGESLASRLARRRRLPPAEVADLLRQVAEGVDEAHRSGIVHRDLKPANIFFAKVQGREIVKVLDFGIAKIVDARRDAFVQTQAGLVLGTPAYMSPEQVLGRQVDGRSDLWALGVIAFECLCGSLPFSGGTLGDLFMRICSGQAPMPSQLTEVPRGVDAWFTTAIALHREDRFSSAAELAQALEAVVGGGARAPGASSASGAWAATTATRLAITRAARRRRTVLLGAAGGVAFAAAAIGLVVALVPPRPRPTAQPAGGAAASSQRPQPLPEALPPAPSEEPPPSDAPAPSESSSAAPVAAPVASASAAPPAPSAVRGATTKPEPPKEKYQGQRVDEEIVIQ